VVKHPSWPQRVDAIAAEDRVAVGAYNAVACDDFRLRAELGPVPCFGAVDTAPVVMLIANPRFDEDATLRDHAFQRSGWPLAALHPDAPSGLRQWWHERLDHLMVAFGAHAVANAVAAVPLTPWASARFDRDLRLPSRPRMLSIGASAAQRGSLIVTTCEPALWTESPAIASLAPGQKLAPRAWRTCALNPANLGESAWALLCGRVESYLRDHPLTP
jgi:hypothetical protein